MLDDKKNFEIFKGKSLSDLFKNIYDNAEQNKSQINTLIGQIVVHISSLTDAATLGPIIKEFMDTSVKNDDHLVKLADIVQKLLRQDKDNAAGGDGFVFSDAERAELLNSFKEVEDDIKKSSNSAAKYLDESDS